MAGTDEPVQGQPVDGRPHSEHTSDWRGGIELANEFTSVRLQLVETATGTRLEIFSPRVGYRVRLDPLALESLTWQPKETFSRFLETPLGPGV